MGFDDLSPVNQQGRKCFILKNKEFDAMLTAMRAGLLSRSQAISAFGYDAEDIDREIAADNPRADALGDLVQAARRAERVFHVGGRPFRGGNAVGPVQVAVNVEL
jgi:hypothetical protein